MSNPHYLKPSSKSATPSRVDESTGLASKIDVSNIPVSKLELGVKLVIGESSDSYTLAVLALYMYLWELLM